MNALTLAAAQTTHINPHVFVVAGYCVAAWLIVLWLKARLMRGRVSRAVSRAYNPGTSHRRLSARSEHRMVTRTTRSRRAERQFRKAALVTALLWAAWLVVHFHPHAH